MIKPINLLTVAGMMYTSDKPVRTFCIVFDESGVSIAFDPEETQYRVSMTLERLSKVCRSVEWTGEYTIRCMW